MLIIPVLTKSDIKKIPYLCLTLIVLNCLIFFFLQSQDSSKQMAAYTYYQESGLLEIELDAYRNYLIARGDEVSDDSRQGQSKQDPLTYKMFRDNDFQSKLDSNQIITPDHHQYQEWQLKRAEHKKLLGQVSVYRYGYSPERNNLHGLLTCMFFHGSIMHLVGNMVFLYLVGVVLEIAIGPSLFLILYLITGVCASALFGFIYPAEPGPLVGASGAIAGLMGSYGVIFGFRKIRVFYSLGFYFNYAMIPALLLFPIWLVKEFFQLFFNVGSNVAYVAHIGGLLSGIIIGAAYKPFLKEKVDSLFVVTEQKQSLENHIDRGLKNLDRLNFSRARQEFEKVLCLEPSNLLAIRQLYLIDKSSPKSEQFHKSVKRLLSAIKVHYPDEYVEVFEEYKSVSSKPRMSIDMVERLCFLYLKKDDLQKAAPLVFLLLKKNPENSKLPGHLLTLADGFNKNQKQEEAERWYRLLVQRYSASDEGLTAAARLTKYR